jgi:hypothetical protein
MSHPLKEYAEVVQRRHDARISFGKLALFDLKRLLVEPLGLPAIASARSEDGEVVQPGRHVEVSLAVHITGDRDRLPRARLRAREIVEPRPRGAQPLQSLEQFKLMGVIVFPALSKKSVEQLDCPPALPDFVVDPPQVREHLDPGIGLVTKLVIDVLGRPVEPLASRRVGPSRHRGCGPLEQRHHELRQALGPAGLPGGVANRRVRRRLAGRYPEPRPPRRGKS